jgi:hypothetical protein
MRFCCPVCGREEEILLDRKPRCLVCRVEMIAESKYADLWMNPAIAMARMKTVSERVGVERARTDSKFKKEREAWTTAVLALALTKLTREQWWIEIVPDEEKTPDTRLRRIDESSGSNVIQTRSIEVVDWEEHVDDVMEVIQEKLKGGYPGHYLLLVHARHVGKVLRVDRIVEEMKKIRSPFLEIWVIVSVGPDQMLAACVAPGALRIDLMVSVELEKASKQSPFLKKGIRGTTPGFRSLGLSYLPLPERD